MQVDTTGRAGRKDSKRGDKGIGGVEKTAWQIKPLDQDAKKFTGFLLIKGNGLAHQPPKEIGFTVVFSNDMKQTQLS